MLNMFANNKDEARMRELVKQETNYLTKSINDMARMWDAKLVKIRHDLDIHKIHRELKMKADDAPTQDNFNAHEYKLCAFENTIVKLATDFEIFSDALNKLRQYINEIRDGQKEVLVGKRNMNCLSCGKLDMLP